MRTLALALLTLVPLFAHDPVATKITYTRDISRLLNRHCIACHSAASPLPLTTYEQARHPAQAFRDQVMTRQMPPWGAVGGFGPALKENPSLTASEIDTVVRWVEGGTPEGDPALLPTAAASKTVAPAPLNGPFLSLQCAWTAPRNVTLTGIRSAQLTTNDQIRITLSLPDGGVRPIIWIRQIDHPRDFVFAQPLDIPRGAVFHVQANGQSVAQLSFTGPNASLLKPEKASPKQTRNCPAP